MKLPAQLVLVSLLALLLPWAGCSYVAQMETALRDNDQANLLRFAGAIAGLIESQPALLADLAPVDPDGAGPLYVHPLSLRVDGYFDADLEGADVVTRWPQSGAVPDDVEPLQAEVILGRAGQDAFLYVAVNDPTAELFAPAMTDVGGADRVRLLLGKDAAGRAARTVWLLQESPGQFVARREQDGRLLAEYNLRPVGRQSAAGYTVEVRFPYAWLDGHFGLRVHDAAAPSRSLGTPADVPVPLIERSAALEEILEGLSDKFDLTVVDSAQWVRAARSGGQSRATVERPPGSWLLEWFYRRITALSDAAETYIEPRGGKLQREEVALALRQQGYAKWYRSPRNAYYGEDGAGAGDAAILSAAVRIADRARGRIAGAVVVERSSADILQLTNTTLVNIAGISTALWVTLFGGLLGYAVWLSLRIRRLNRQVSAVMAPDGRQLHALPAQTAADEIGELGRSFDQLLGRVRGYTDYLQTLGSKLSHELRTPLAVVGSSLDNLEHEALPAASREYLARARSGAERLGHILTALSEASRVEQAIAATAKERIDLSEWLQQVAAGYATAFPRLNFETATGDGTLHVRGCPELLAQMFDKLVDNARDFCPPDGTIRLTAEAADGAARLTVENDGPPLPAGMEDKLFESMVSARSGSEADVHLGLGLHIVRLIVDFHGGSVRAENRTGGDGVRMVVILPA